MVFEGIGSRIKGMRIKLGLTQEELSQKIGINRATISAYEKEKIIPPLEKIQLISDALGCNPGYLMGTVERCLNEPAARALERAYNAPVGALQKYTQPYTAREAAEIKLAQLKAEQRKNKILHFFSLLNDSGKDEAINRLEEMTMIPKYRLGSADGGNDHG